MNPVAELFRMIGPAVFVKIVHGEKRPICSAWQTLTLADMTSEYFAGFNGCNIGVSLGVRSDHLCTIDCDNDDSLEEFLNLNPLLRETLISRGARGGNIWIRFSGGYPKNGKIVTSNGKPWGEFRGTGCQTVIWGKHPSACDYRNNGKKPLRVHFDKIIWSAGLRLPWVVKHVEVPPCQVAGLTWDDAFNAVVAKWSRPYHKSDSGAITVNENFFAALFAARRHVLFEVTEGQFYLYREATGAWTYTNVAFIKQIISEDWREFARRENSETLTVKGTNGLISAICDLLRSHVAKTGIFKPRYGTLHCANGMLKIRNAGTILRPFSPDYYSRNPIPIAWNPRAVCPRFIDVLLRPALDPDDIDLLMRWTGSVLLGRNIAQRFMLLEGTAGGGKGTFVEILEAIIGEDNSVQMRTALLNERFEVGRYLGKLLLGGKDVPGNFLEEKGASVIKSLVGSDKLTGEIKGSMETPSVKGQFGMVITCNSRPRVRLDGDIEAWRRRMIRLRYERPKPEHRIAGFSEKLIKEEAEGILALFVSGAIRHLNELRETGDFFITAAQQRRVDDLLLESDSLRYFAGQRICATDGGVLSTEDIMKAYYDFCKEQGWAPLPRGRFQRELPGIMMEMFGSNLGSHAKSDNDKRAKGYPRVALVRFAGPGRL